MKQTLNGAISSHMFRGTGLVCAALLALAGCAQTGGKTDVAPQIGPNTLNVADAAIAGGDPNMALSVSQSILKSDPDNTDALVHEGDAYYALDRCPSAIAAFRLALKYDAKSSPAETGLGRCLLRTDPRAAEEAFMAAVRDDPGNADALNDLGIARDLQGHFSEAVEPYEKALLADPSLTATEVNLGLSLALSGHGAEALQYLGPLAAGQEATPKIREDYAAALIATGRDAQARQVLAVDLPSDKVDEAMNGLSALIASSIQTPSPPPPPGPTVPDVKTTSVTATPVAPTTAPAASSPPAKPTPLLPVANASPVAAQPVTAAMQSPPAMTAAPAAPGVAVQLAALGSDAAAKRVWVKEAAGSPALFAGKSPDISQAVVNGKTYYRLRISGFADRGAAEKFCAKLALNGDACTLADF